MTVSTTRHHLVLGYTVGECEFPELLLIVRSLIYLLRRPSFLDEDRTWGPTSMLDPPPFPAPSLSSFSNPHPRYRRHYRVPPLDSDTSNVAQALVRTPKWSKTFDIWISTVRILYFFPPAQPPTHHLFRAVFHFLPHPPTHLALFAAVDFQGCDNSTTTKPI